MTMSLPLVLVITGLGDPGGPAPRARQPGPGAGHRLRVTSPPKTRPDLETLSQCHWQWLT